MAASSFSSLLLLFFFSQLLSTAFTSRHGFIDDPLIQQVVSSNSHDHDLLTSAEHHFLAFKRKYGKSYPTQEEDDYRFGVFISNLRQAWRNQIEDPTAVHGVTIFSDLTLSEFLRQYSSGHPTEPIPDDVDESPPLLPDTTLPKKFNWATKENRLDRPAVTSVKNQSTCDGCWAFSTVAVIEGAHFLTNKELVNLSVQQLIDCSRGRCSKTKPEVCNCGCDGGHRFLSFDYVNDTHTGLVKEEENPFIDPDKNGLCEKQGVASIYNYSYVHYNEYQYAIYLTTFGPLSVSVDAEMLKDYDGKTLCFKSKPVSQISAHAVTLVGFDNTTAPLKWIVKNSYGEKWGVDGYFTLCHASLPADDVAIFAVAKPKARPEPGKD